MSENIASKRQQNISIKAFRCFSGRKYDGVVACLSIATTGIEEIATSFAHVAIGLLVIMLFVIVPKVSAQKSSGGHFIHRWLALAFIEGETAPKAIGVDYLLVAIGMPESRFATLEGAPKAGDIVSLTLEGYATQERIWKVLSLPENGDVNEMLVVEGDIDNAVAYLLTFIESEEVSKRELKIRSDDAVKVWLNGEVVHTAAVNRSLVPDQDRMTVDLKRGMNCLMVKVAESMGDWQLTARLDDENGLQFFDTPSRKLVPLGKRPIRLPNPQLEALTEGVWKTYQYVDGLASNWVSAIMQDTKGVIWFGTDGGVSWFDGRSWKAYTQEDRLTSNPVYAILQDKEGAMWFGTDGGVSRFDGKSWQIYTQEDGLVGNPVYAITQDKEGGMWFGTGWPTKGTRRGPFSIRFIPCRCTVRTSLMTILSPRISLHAVSIFQAGQGCRWRLSIESVGS